MQPIFQEEIRMKNICRGLAATLACALAPAVLADPPADVMNIVREADIKWQANPLVPGLATAVVQGDPKDPGKPYVLRVRFPPNTMSPPHFHPEARHIVVLKGTWWVGAGPKWDREATTPVPAPTFVIPPPNKIHHAAAQAHALLLHFIPVPP